MENAAICLVSVCFLVCFLASCVRDAVLADAVLADAVTLPFAFLPEHFLFLAHTTAFAQSIQNTSKLRARYLAKASRGELDTRRAVQLRVPGQARMAHAVVLEVREGYVAVERAQQVLRSHAVTRLVEVDWHELVRPILVCRELRVSLLILPASVRCVATATYKTPPGVHMAHIVVHALLPIRVRIPSCAPQNDCTASTRAAAQRKHA